METGWCCTSLAPAATASTATASAAPAATEPATAPRHGTAATDARVPAVRRGSRARAIAAGEGTATVGRGRPGALTGTSTAAEVARAGGRSGTGTAAVANPTPIAKPTAVTGAAAVARITYRRIVAGLLQALPVLQPLPAQRIVAPAELIARL